MAEGSSRASLSVMKPPEDDERIMIDSIPIMVWRCRRDGFVGFFYRRWLEYTGLSLHQPLGWGWTVAIHADDLNRCVHSI
jgi:PAS domain-containing protein